jgi:signal transduction histidine kinase
VNQVGRQVDRLVPLVDEMLDVTRIQRGKLEIQCERFDLSQLVVDVTESYAPLLSGAGCTVQVDCSAGIVGHWDRFRIEQVLTNLLSNAARYSGRGRVHVQLGYAGEGIELRVSDEGPGVPAEDRERIFQPFERAGANSGTAGLGLGLHIVRQIVEMHGGSIHVEDAAGGGACFVVRLPLSEPRAQENTA